MSQDSCDDGIEQPAPSALQIEEAIQSDKSPVYKRMTFWNVVFNGTLAVTTALLGMLAKSANDTSQESLRVSQASYQVSERAMKMAEQAWVTVKDASIIGPVEVGKLPTVKVTFQNNGHSPAVKAKLRHWISILKMKNWPDMPMPQPSFEGESVAVVGPEAITSSEVVLSRPLTKEDVAHLKGKDWVISTYGIFTYNDIFDSTHETKFCMIWRDATRGALSPCDKWNEAN